VYSRVKTLLKKKEDNKKVDLDKTFFPRCKRVLNRTNLLRVLNKPVKKKKKAGSTKPMDTVLDSQVSLPCSFFDSQGCAPASPPTPEQNLSLCATSTPVSPFELSPPASPLILSQTQILDTGSPRAQAAHTPGKCVSALVSVCV